MISFILLLIFGTWVLINRFSKGGKIEGHPLGMPRGTVRALSTIMIVAFPFGYIITGEAIPSLIVNVIFVVVAFYFEARRSEREKIRQIVNEMKSPDIIIEDPKKEKKPLYLPKYSVRILLVLMLTITLIANYFGPQIPFEVTNTIFDLLIIIILFIIGASFRSIVNSRERKKLKEKIANMDASLTELEIIEKLMLEESSWWKRKGRNVLSITMFILVVSALICFTFRWDLTIFNLTDYSLTLIGFLLLLINAYYGFRD
jgi:H+/gluconate symporter-like permease